jgi:nucleotide-binding universal stress UspA family protein
LLKEFGTKIKNMKTILVPIDFSNQSKHALDLAVQIARKGNVKIEAINIIEGLQPSSFNTMGEGVTNYSEDEFFLRKLFEKTKENLQNLVEQKKFEGVSIRTSVEVGNPYQSISKAIADHKADLVVMGTKGISGIDEVLIGSNTERVVRYAKCPVITIKSAVDFSEMKNIVLATNLAGTQTELVTEIKKIQALTKAKIHVVKVNTPNYFHTQRQADKEFDKFIANHSLDNFDTVLYNETTEEDGILSYAEDVQADLIAIGTHGRTGILHLISGSIAEDLVNHSQIPVWTLSMKK